MPSITLFFSSLSGDRTTRQLDSLFYGKGWFSKGTGTRKNAMPGDPNECRAHAARCEELAKMAENPEHARVLTHLARQWLRLALQLERAQAVLKERRRITRKR